MEPLRPRDPKAIGPYKLVGRLGAGGMGVVYIASKSSETVALKIIRDSIIDDPSQATRFIREIATLKSIDSPHVAKVLDTGKHNERPWFTTEFVNGPDLKSHVTDKGPILEASWDALAKGLLDGIAAIHAAGVTHRDIKPANIILSESGPKIIDFGIAQVADATSVTSTGAIAGTPAWFSPEQIEGSEISTATDLFSAGSTLVYAATGKSPWGDVEATTKGSVYKILLDEPDLSGLSEKQSRLVRPLLNKDPSARYRDGKARVEANQEVPILSGESWFQRLGHLSRSKKLAWSLAMLLVATSGGLVLNTFATPKTLEAGSNVAGQVEGDEEYSPPCKKPTISDNFVIKQVSSGKTVEILVAPKVKIAGCVGAVEKVVALVQDLRNRRTPLSFYGVPWTPVTCETGNRNDEAVSPPPRGQSAFELASVGPNQFELICVDEGALEPWPLEITYLIELENFEYPIQYVSSSELSPFRE